MVIDIKNMNRLRASLYCAALVFANLLVSADVSELFAAVKNAEDLGVAKTIQSVSLNLNNDAVKSPEADNSIFDFEQAWRMAQAAADRHKGDEPVYLMRYVQSLQDDIVAGKFVVRPLLRPVLAEIGKRFLATDEAVWRKKSNLYALLNYLFSGGDPDVAVYVLKGFGSKIMPKPIIDGAQAYIAGDRDKFIKCFTPFVDDKDVPWDVRSAIALNAATYMLEKQPKEARRLFDTVRISAPGSFFEEAAIRREMPNALKLEDTVLVKNLMRSYIMRFHNSPYSNELWRSYLQAIESLQYAVSAKDLAILLEPATEKIRYYVYLHVSRHQLVEGDLHYAQTAALQAIYIGNKNHYDVNSALLYYASSMLASPNATLMNKILQDVDATKLRSQDRPLFVASEAIMDYLTNEMLPEPNAQARRNLQMVVTSDEVASFLNKVRQDNHKEVMAALLASLNEKKVSLNGPAATNVSGFIKNSEGKINYVDKLLESADGTS